MSRISTDEKISIIVPTYKRAHLIGRSISSILAQTYKNYEIIVVNDGPVDGTEEVVKAFHDERIIFIQHSSNKGISTARNTGVQAASGKLIAFLDSDDEWKPEKLEKQVMAFLQADDAVGIVYTERFDTVDNIHFTIPSSIVSKREGNITDILLQGSLITLQTAMIKKVCFESAGLFDVNCIVFEDWEIWLRMSRQYKFKYISEPLVIIHSDPTEEHASRNFQHYIGSLEYILQKHKAAFYKAPKKVLARHYYYLASLLLRGNRKKEARKYLKLAIRTFTTEPKYYIAYILSVIGIVIKRN